MNKHSKVAIVTGASQGIGAGIAAALAARDYRVVSNSRSIPPRDDDAAVNIAGEIADPFVAAEIVTAAIDRFGRIDTLINNAGVFIAKPFTDYAEADYAEVVSVNLGGFFRITQRAAAQMLRQGFGHIVTITSSLADQPMVEAPSALASLTKGGLNAVTRSLAIEYAAKGVRVNAVSPGIIKTPMHPPARHADLARLHPMGRMGEVQEIVEAVLYLEGAAFVTGEVLHVDGGQHAGHW